MKIVKEGLWIILPSLMIPLALIIITGWRSWALIFIFSGVMLFFFRDPKRVLRVNCLGILAPADGKILWIEKRPDAFTVYIELSLLNCHLQRAPINGIVTNVTRVSGLRRPFHIFLPKLGRTDKKIRAAMENEQNIIEIQMENSKFARITQIVGAFARRLKSFVNNAQIIQKGEKVGLIYFGSMVKLEVEGEFEVEVQEGDKIKAGLSVIAMPKNL
jgi:phosphatidylserine decarboxylase